MFKSVVRAQSQCCVSSSVFALTQRALAVMLLPLQGRLIYACLINAVKLPFVSLAGICIFFLSLAWPVCVHSRVCWGRNESVCDSSPCSSSSSSLWLWLVSLLLFLLTSLIATRLPPPLPPHLSSYLLFTSFDSLFLAVKKDRLGTEDKGIWGFPIQYCFMHVPCVYVSVLRSVLVDVFSCCHGYACGHGHFVCLCVCVCIHLLHVFEHAHMLV